LEEKKEGGIKERGSKERTGERERGKIFFSFT
jgi:hypothetical protein